MTGLQESISDILPINPIRVETGLSRYPVHRIAKHGEIAIDIRERNGSGEVSIKWSVSYNSGFGQPGPLAYKLDTLIINRRIEEAARPVPRIIKLGSLTEICRELGQADSGENTKHAKNALRQNAFAAIIAKIQYRQNDGKERAIEADFTRYSIVFTGEELPDGRKADAVYIVLNDIYMQVINGAITRPLDYDYLKNLPPAPQRFYELLSYQMYAAIKNDRARAKLLYSEFCKYAPLTRHIDWMYARKQMAKIHAPHRKSGYITKIDFEQTVDADGVPDWLMLYQPGPKARAEFRAFTKRGGPVMLEMNPFTAEALTSLSAAESPPLVAELIGHGVTEAIARQLVAEYDEAKIRQQIEIIDWQEAKKPGKISDPAAWLVIAIKNGHATPKGFVSAAVRLKNEEAKRDRQQAATAERRREYEAEAQETRERKEAAAYWEALTPDQQAELQAVADAASNPADLALEKGPLKRMGQHIRREAYIRQLLKERQAALSDT